MHTRNRSWNVPLGIGLFGAAILVGGAILAIPETKKAPSHVDVSDPIKSKPFPSFPEETHPTIPGSQLSDEAATSPGEAAPRGSVRAPLPAPTGIGGGRPERGEEEPPEPDEIEPPEQTRGAPPSPAPVPTPAPATGTTAQPIAANGADDAGAATPPQSFPDGGSTAVSDGQVQILPPDGGIYGVAIGDAMIGVDPNAPYIYPTFGTPGAATAGTVVGPGGVTAPASGATGGSSGGMTTQKQTISAPLLLPISDAPERFWSEVAPFLKSGDAVVANVTSDTSPLLAFAERAHTDAPLVTYVVAFANTTQLESAVSKGLPATLTVVGLSSSAGVTDAALGSAATKVHDNGRRAFLTLKYPTDGPSLAAVAKSVDVVELVVGGANSNEVATNAKTAATSLGPKVQLYIRLPASLTSPTNASSATSAINAAIPNAGVSLPSSAAASIGSYRTR